MAKPLRVWIGNFDGKRQGLVVTTTKATARRVLSVGVVEFEAYWVEQPRDFDTASFKLDTLYSRPFGSKVWVEGRCALPPRKP